MRRIGVVSAETEALAGRWRVAVPLLLTAQWVLIVIYAILLVLPGLGVTGWPRDVLVGNLVYAAPAAVIMARALLVPADRTWCLLLVCGMVSFLSGNLVFLWIERLGDPPFPSWADLGYVGIYPFVIAALLVSLRARMGRMRQSIAEIEEAFFEEIEEDRERRERLRRHAEQRARSRHVAKTHRSGTLRFSLVLLTLIATAVIVTIVMFNTLYYVMR